MLEALDGEVKTKKGHHIVLSVRSLYEIFHSSCSHGAPEWTGPDPGTTEASGVPRDPSRPGSSLPGGSAREHGQLRPTAPWQVQWASAVMRSDRYNCWENILA